MLETYPGNFINQVTWWFSHANCIELSPDFFGTKFDVILVDPPWEEYVHRAPGITDHIEYWNVEEIMNLKIEVVAFI